MKLERIFPAALAVMVSLVGFSAGAYADSFRLRLEDVGLGVGVVITDQGPGDSNPLVGAITFIGAAGAFPVNVTSGTSKPVVGGVNNAAQLDLNSVNIVTTGPAMLRITLEDTDYAVPPGNLVLQASVGGVLTAPTGSLVTFQSWVNPANLVPVLGPDTFPAGALPAIGATPAGSIEGFTPIVSFGPGAFAATDSAEFINTGVFSLFGQATANFTGPGTLSFSETQTVVPEPASLLLFGTGFLGVAIMRRYSSKFA